MCSLLGASRASRRERGEGPTHPVSSSWEVGGPSPGSMPWGLCPKSAAGLKSFLAPRDPEDLQLYPWSRCSSSCLACAKRLSPKEANSDGSGSPLPLGSQTSRTPSLLWTLNSDWTSEALTGANSF